MRDDDHIARREIAQRVHARGHRVAAPVEQDRALAWLTGTLDLAGNHDPGGWWWRYDIEPAPEGNGSRVTLTYNWNDTPNEFREEVGGMPPFPPEYLDNSLAELGNSLAT